MTREEIIKNLKYTMEKHKNDYVHTFDTDISLMCKDILDYLEQEPKLMVGIDLYSVIKQKYIEREVLNKIREEIKVMTSNRGFLSCSVEYIHKEIDNVFDKYKADKEQEWNVGNCLRESEVEDGSNN